MTKKLLLPMLLFAAWATSACQAPPPVDTALVEPEAARQVGYKHAMVLDLGLSGHQRVQFVAVLGDLLVLVETPVTMVTAVSVNDGTFRWRRVVGTPSQRLFQPVPYKDKIVINAESELFILSAANGQLKERHKLIAPVNHHPAMYGPLAIFGSVTGLVFAHDLVSGFSLWRRDVSAEILTSPLVFDDDVFVTDANGRCEMLGAANGNLLWTARTFGAISAAPAINPIGLFLASEDQSLYSLTRANGRDRWIYRAAHPLRSSPVLIDQMVLLPEPNHRLTAIDARSGQKLWHLTSQAQPILHLDDKVLLHDSQSLMLVDLDSGKLERQIPVQPILAVRGLENDGLLLVGPKGRILRLDRTR